MADVEAESVQSAALLSRGWVDEQERPWFFVGLVVAMNHADGYRLYSGSEEESPYDLEPTLLRGEESFGFSGGLGYEDLLAVNVDDDR